MQKKVNSVQDILKNKISQKRNDINKWFKSLNQLEKTIILVPLVSLCLGIGFLPKLYWHVRWKECEKHLAYYEAAKTEEEQLKRFWAYDAYTDCGMKTWDDQLNSWF